jgi:hypothetical protein
MELRVGQVWRSPDTGNRWRIVALGEGDRLGLVDIERLLPRPKWDDGRYCFHVEQFQLLQLEPEEPMRNLEALAKDARDLANDLFRQCGEEAILDCGTPAGTPTCLQREEARPLTREEKKLGWARRPFSAYEPGRLCGGCAAYWYAEMCAQQLHRLHCLAARAEAQERARRPGEAAR